MNPWPVLILGTGRLGCSLGAALLALDPSLLAGAVYHSPAGRQRAERWLAGARLASLDAAQPLLETARTIVLCVRDDVIAEVCDRLRPWLSAGQIVVHTAGLLDSRVLRHAEMAAAVGSFHPLQTFVDPAKAAERFRDAFVACEGDADAVAAGRALAERLQSRAIELAPGTKAAYHAAAVVASNYLIALTELAARLAGVAGIDRRTALDMLAPLQRGALDNLASMGPAAALTGPIARADVETIQAHLEVIDAHCPEVAPTYAALGQIAVDLAAQQGADEARLASIRKLLSNQS